MSFCNKLQSKTDFDDEIAFFEETMENVSGVITNKTMFLKSNDDILQNRVKPRFPPLTPIL
jgi:predicted HicB family RNase H-like nuclease